MPPPHPTIAIKQVVLKKKIQGWQVCNSIKLEMNCACNVKTDTDFI